MHAIVRTIKTLDTHAPSMNHKIELQEPSKKQGHGTWETRLGHETTSSGYGDSCEYRQMTWQDTVIIITKYISCIFKYYIFSYIIIIT